MDIQHYDGGSPQFCVKENFYICKAIEAVLISQDTLKEFNDSWGAVEHILYYRIVDNKTFTVHCALPCFDRLLKEIMDKLAEFNSIPDMPTVKAFCMNVTVSLNSRV